jgi:hypothetical protein
MTQLHAIGDTLERRDRLLDVVFVHGAGGHYLNSWGLRRELQGGEQDSMLYWLLDDPELKDIGVWSLQHESDKTIFGQQGSITRTELAENVIQLLTNHNGIRPATPQAPPSLIWIAHSDGGNVVKVLLNICQQVRSGKSPQDKTADWIIRATQSVYFIDTPHLGTRLANVLGWIPVSRRAAELKRGSDQLRQVTDWFREQAKNLNIEWLIFYQTRQAPIRVVGADSARPVGFSRAVSIDRSHNAIAKPSGKDQEPYASIRADVCRIARERSALQEPVAALPPRLQRQQVQPIAPAEPSRLLLFIAPVPAHREGSKSSNDSRYSLRCWFRKGASEKPRETIPAQSNDCDIDPDNLSFDQLAEAIAGAYVDEWNGAPEFDQMDNTSLLPVVFLPEELLTQPRLGTLLAEFDEVVCRRLAQFGIIGMPFFLACSSRWPVHGYRHRLNDTLRFLKDASRAVAESIFSEPPAKLAELSWLSIANMQADGSSDPQLDAAPNAPVRIAKSLSGQTIDRIAAGAGDAKDQAEHDAAFQDRDAILLRWQPDSAAVDRVDGLRLGHLLSLAKPLIWWEAGSSTANAVARSLEQTSTHPMDLILDWEGPEFLAIFHRLRSYRTKPVDSLDPAIQDYLRSSTIFWEDHRYLPPITRTSAPMSTPFR